MHITLEPENRIIDCQATENLLSVLRRAGVSVASACGSRGKCGKCKVKLNCFTLPCDAEKELLTTDELAEGIRLACKTEVRDGMTVKVLLDNSSIAAVEYESAENISDETLTVVDLGTTTVTVARVGKNGDILSAKSETNAQSAFGADVLTRITAIETDGGEQHRLIVEQLLRMAGGKAKQLVIAGNTVMLHLLLGEDCTGIGRFPFTPAFLGAQTRVMNGVEFCTLPCLHSFIGADISAGIIDCAPEDDYKLLIDLGTNAEIALFNREKVFAASAAAGPAFEGANIRCGCAAVPGAISSFKIERGIKTIETVGQKPPVGLCGSGLLDTIAALLDNGTIDETGLMDCGEYKIAERVSLFAQDVREFQLAKAAVRTAVDLLLDESGIGAGEIKQVLLSGGFGTFLNVSSAVRTGLLPPEFEKITVAAGNTSLSGAAKYACGNALLPSQVSVLNLATANGFNDRFVENILFA